MNQYQNEPKDASGRLFPKTQAPISDKHPTWQGDVTLSYDMLQALLQLSQRRNNGDVRLRVVAWDKQGKAGHYISMSGRIDRLQPGDDPSVLQNQGPQGMRQQPRVQRAPQAQPPRQGYQRPQRPFNDNPNFYEPRDQHQGGQQGDDDIPWENNRR